MGAINIPKKLVAGVPAVVIGTDANETASIALALFGHASSVKIDAKVIEADYAIPQNRFDATQFNKVASHAGGALDVTNPYFEETLGGASYKYLLTSLGNKTIRLLDPVTNLFKVQSTIPAHPASTRDSAIALGKFALNYAAPGGTLTCKTIAAGTLNKMTDVSALATNASRSGFSYRGVAGQVDGAGSFAFTMDAAGYMSYMKSFDGAAGVVVNSDNRGADLYHFVYNTQSGGYQPYMPRAAVVGNYLFAFYLRGDTSYQTVYASSAPISGFHATQNFTNPGWTARTSLGSPVGLSPSDVLDANSNIAEIGGTLFFLMTTQAGAPINNQALFKAAANGATGAVTGLAMVQGDIDGSYTPLRVGNKLVYRRTGGEFIAVDSAGVVVAYAPPAPLARPHNMKALAANYAAYNQFKFTDGASSTDGLAYAHDAAGGSFINGVSFFTKDGKYTLIRDDKLKKLDAVGTDEQWVERQCSAPRGARVQYGGFTLGPNQALWMVADKDVQLDITGFKGQA